MPKIPPATAYKTVLTGDALINALVADREAFQDGFERSRRTGSLWRDYGGLRVTVFYRNGHFNWSIADGSGPYPRYSQDAFETEEDALSALATELGVGEL